MNIKQFFLALALVVVGTFVFMRAANRNNTTIIPDDSKTLRVITPEQLQTLGDVRVMIGFDYCGVPIAVQLIGSKGFYVQVIYPEAPETLDAAQAALQFGKDSGAPFKRVELREGCKTT